VWCGVVSVLQRALSDTLGLVIHVVTSDQQHWYMQYEPEELKGHHELFLTYVAPIHYNSLR
jgi:hypothetical protein